MTEYVDIALSDLVSFCMRVYMSEYLFYNTRLRLRGFSFAERTRIALLRWTEVVCLCMCVMCVFLYANEFV